MASRPAGAHVACVYTGRERELAGDALVLVTARLPDDGLVDARCERPATCGRAGLMSVARRRRRLGPGTIAAAVWDGRRYAEELDGPGHGDAVPFRREVVALADRWSEPSA